MCQGEDSEEGEAAGEKNDDGGATEVATPTPTTEAAAEKPKVKYWPRPAQSRPARNGNLELLAAPSKIPTNL